MNRTVATTLIASLVGCQRTQPTTQNPRAQVSAAPDVLVSTGAATLDAAAPSQRSANAPDRGAIPEGAGWSCIVEDADGGLREDTCKRTASACSEAVARVTSGMAESARLARQLGVRMPGIGALRCVEAAQAHCITYSDAQDSQVHWDCSRTAERCAARQRYFRNENQRGESVVRYRSISDCEVVN